MAGALFPSDGEIDRLVVGPDSVAWRSTSDVRLNIAVLYPLLLQVAHPTIDAAVSDHSDFDQRPWDRFLATADYLNLLVYGGRGAAAAGRRLRAVHGRFRGRRADGAPYSALEPAAYAWVHATLLDTFVRATACFTTAMAPADTERFYLEYRGLGRLIGVRECDLPPTWSGFRAYFRRTAHYQLSRTASVDRVLNAVRDAASAPAPIPSPLWRAINLPARRALWRGGMGLMDPATRRRFEIGWSRIDEAEFALLSALSRGLTPVMPTSLKITGPEHLRVRTRAIAQGPLG
ncbi:MAG: oxygenase MpaB family protein [Solirubrobacteraceae bacterium]